LERSFKAGRSGEVLAARSGLMRRPFAESGRGLGRADYVTAARRNAEFVLGSMRTNGRLLRTWKAGEARLKGYLEDHAMVTAALLDLYASSFDRLWLDEARGIVEAMLRLFWDDGVGGFFDTGADHEHLIVRPRNLYDNAVPCGSSVAVEVLLRLAALTGEERYERHALSALRPMADLLGRHPTAFGRFLCALDFHIGPQVEAALVAPRRMDDTQPLAARRAGAQLDELLKQLPPVGGGRGSPGDVKIGQALKQALQIGTENAVKLTGRTDGYFKNEAIKILMPEKLKTFDRALRTVGYDRDVDDFVLKMNRAAERAAPAAKQIFWDAIGEMTIDDARGILDGPATAATDYFKTKTTGQLTSAFSPVVHRTMAEVGVTKRYEDL